MPYVQMVAILRKALRAIGMSEEEVKSRTFNTMRRFMPTAANVFHFPPSKCQAIGSWEDIPQGDGRIVAVASRPMSLHYSDEQALCSGEAKAEVFQAFREASLRHPGVQSIVSGGTAFLPRHSLSWSSLASHARSLKKLDDAN